MKQKTQKYWVISQLRKNKEITRNQCLQNYISRLGSIICELKKEGWKFDPSFRKTSSGKDYVYKVVDEPLQTLFSD